MSEIRVCCFKHLITYAMLCTREDFKSAFKTWRRLKRFVKYMSTLFVGLYSRLLKIVKKTWKDLSPIIFKVVREILPH